jgi:hypothetical protein
MTRDDLVKKLAERGIKLERRSQATYHLIGYAGMESILCLGPDTPNGKSTYVSLEGWVGQQPLLSGASAQAELAFRYLAGYGPASPKDLASWSGLPMSDVKHSWKLAEAKAGLVEIQVEDHSLWMLASQAHFMSDLGAGSPIVRLLPAFDTYLLGYADRRYLVYPEHQPEVYHGGQTVPVVLVNGAAAGVWRYERRGKRLEITVRPFDSFEPPIQHLITEEAEDIGRFWDVPVSLQSKRL